MAGYSGFSMSNNALEAYERGLAPASKVRKPKGVTSKMVKALVEPVERHHTSKYYNLTDFYCPDEITLAFNEGYKDIDVCEVCGHEHLRSGWATRIIKAYKEDAGYDRADLDMARKKLEPWWHLKGVIDK